MFHPARSSGIMRKLMDTSRNKKKIAVNILLSNVSVAENPISYKLVEYRQDMSNYIDI